MVKTKILRPIPAEVKDGKRFRLVVSLEEYERANRAPEGLALCIKDVDGNFWDMLRTFNYKVGCPELEATKR